MKERLLELLAVSGVSGFEGQIEEHSAKQAQWHAKTEVDRRGNHDRDDLVRLLETLILEMDQGGMDAEKV